MEIRRPLKRAAPKLGPPDIYPQDPKQKEDELTSVNVKQGYTSTPLVSGSNNLDEFGTAKNANIDAFGVYFSALLSEKHRINTLKDTQKKKQLVNTKEIWYVHAKTKHAVDNWFRDLANGTKTLGHLGKRIPIFNSKEGMFSQLYESKVPLTKAVWFIKMSAVHAVALSESSSKSKKRQVPDQYQELTAALTKYLKDISIRISDCYQQSQHHIQQLQQQQQPAQQQQLSASANTSANLNLNSQSILQHRNILKSTSLPSMATPMLNNQPNFTSNINTSAAILMSSQTASVASLSATSVASLPIVHEDFIPTFNQWQYQTQLARYLFDEGLLDQYDFLCFLLELIEKKRPINDLVVKIICPLILEYVIDFSRSAVLSRRLAHVCAKKLCQALHHHPMSARSMRKNEQTQQQAPSIPNALNNFGLTDNLIARHSLTTASTSSKYNHYESKISDTQSSSLLRNSSSTANNNHLTANSILDIVKAQIIESQNNLMEGLTNDQENNENNLYRNAIYILSSIIQVICIECPTAMVRHHIVDAKFPPMFQGSPIDHLPCLPSSLPMMESDLNFELRKSIHDAEREILHRSAMADSKWSCDSSSKLENSKGGLVNRLLSVMDILDRHNFDKIDSSNSIDTLYCRIFPSLDCSSSNKSINTQSVPSTNDVLNLSASAGVLDLSSTSSTLNYPSNMENSKKMKHQPTPLPQNTNTNTNQDEQALNIHNSCEEHVVKLLCEWATTTQRTGEHRAIVVARLLEKRQVELQATLLEVSPKNTSQAKLKKFDDSKAQQSPDTPAGDVSKSSDCGQNDNNNEQHDEIVHFPFQNILLQFLDDNAPVIEDNEENLDNKKAFNNLVLLFSELIRCDVFSHYNYMCTLISRGMFNDLSKNLINNLDGPNVDSPAPNSNLNQPGSVKQPKSVQQPDSILSNTIQGLSGSSGIYPLTVSTNTGNQSNHLDPLSNSKLGSNADQSLRSLGFSPVSSQNVSQNMDKGHGLLDNHIDDVDADLGKILQDIKEGQQDEAADILLPDYLGSLREDGASKNPPMNKLSPFGLGDRSSNLDNPNNTAANILSNRGFPSSSVDMKTQIALNSSTTNEKSSRNESEHRHLTFVKHFPVPDDENFIHDNNQRNVLLYGFGKEREDGRHAMKKLNKEICNRLFHRKASRDINDGGKIKKVLNREWFNPEATLFKFDALNHHDQHIITNSLSITMIEMFAGVSNGQTFLLPTLEAVSFVFDLFAMASNVTGLLEMVVPILEELPDVEAQIKLKCPSLANQYTDSIALCIIGMLYRYNGCVLLLQKDELCSIFESLHKLVSHINNPTNCTTSAERVIFYYLYDLYSSQSGRIFDQFNGLIQKIKQTLLNAPPMIYNTMEHEWSQTLLSTIVGQLRMSQVGYNSSTNPILNASSGMNSLTNFSQLNANDISALIRQQLYVPDSPTVLQMNEVPAARYRFVCDAILLSATSTHPDLVNDIGILCADITSKCPPLLSEWMHVLQALCCSAQRDLGYRQLLNKINITDPQVMDNIAIFTAILVARRCLELDGFILKCAIGAIVAPLGPVDKQLSEPGVRLTCHLLLALFRDRDSPLSTKSNLSSLTNSAFNHYFSCYGNSTPNYGSSLLTSVSSIGGLLQTMNKEQDYNTKSMLNLKYLCDHHLLRSACCSIKTECHITLLKAIRVLAMWANPHNDLESQGRIKTENHFEDASIDGIGLMSKDVDTRDSSPGGLNSDSNFNVKQINLQTASLHQFADAILRLLCSQRWLHDKCVSDSEIFTTTETDKNLLLDPRMGPKQSQRLLYMICYNKSPEKQADIGLDDQGSDQVVSIVKMFENLDVWSMRLSLMRLQYMFAYCKSQSTSMLNDWLDNLAKAVVDFFQKASQESENLERDSDDSSDDMKETKCSTKSIASKSSSIANINKVWLIEPLLNKLTKPPSAVQNKIIKASAALMESASVRANSLPSLNQTYLSTAAASTKFKERTLSQRGSASTNPSNLASTSLLGFQPFLSLLMSCLKSQDKERDTLNTLLTSLNSQLYQAIHEKVDDIGYKQSLQDGLELRLCLIGQMFESIQRSANLTSDWATLLLLLIMNNLVDPQVDYGLYVSVLDMLATLIHAAYASDPIEQKEESKKQYQNLMKKFRKELTALEEKGFIQMKLINPLMPLVRQMTEVITCEPMGSLVDTKGEKVENFYSIDKKKGLKVSELQEVSPWDLIEGHKNPAPLSWPWFGAIRLEQKPLRSDENNRLMSWHTHSVRHTTAYFCQVPNVDDGPPNAKRSNTDKKPSQSNPLLKSLIENDEVSSIKNDNNHSNDEDPMLIDYLDDNYIGREDLVEEYCELPVDMLFDSTPIETMIEDIKTAMQAEQAALTSRAKSQQLADTKPILNAPQASSILAPIQPDPNRSTTPQVSALSALQNHLNSASSVETSILMNSGPGSVPPPPLSMSPAIVNPHTPELIPRPPSTMAKIVPTPPPMNVANRSLSPMVAARSPAVAATPPPKPRAPRKKRATKKDSNVAMDANANIPANINKNSNQINMIPSTVTGYSNNLDGLNHSAPPQMIINQPKLVPNPQPMHQQMQQQQPQQGMMVRRAPIAQSQPQQQASVYDFQYQSQPQQSSNQFVNSGPMNSYYEQAPSNNMFNQAPQQQQQQQQQAPPQMQISVQPQHQHIPQQVQHPMQAQQHIQQQQQHQHQHHQIQYQQPTQHPQQHGGPPHQQHIQSQQIRLTGHQHQPSMSFQQIPQHQHPQQIFAPQQAAGHSRPALTDMLHRKHAAAGNIDNKMHPGQQRFNFG